MVAGQTLPCQQQVLCQGHHGTAADHMAQKMAILPFNTFQENKKQYVKLIENKLLYKYFVSKAGSQTEKKIQASLIH